MFQNAVLHLDLDAFFASVEVLKNSALKGKPLIVGGTSDRGVVASCSYEARRFGVRSAMPVRMALKLCPDAIVLRGDHDEYSRYSKLVTDVIDSEAPMFEKASIDEFYLDLSGMDKYVGCWKWSNELRAKIVKESGLQISLALTDINNTSCAGEFVRLCQKEGIKPVLGIDFRSRDGQRLFTGIARNSEGFCELNRLLSDCSLDGQTLPEVPPMLPNAFIIYPKLIKPIALFKENEFLGVRPEHVHRISHRHRRLLRLPKGCSDGEMRKGGWVSCKRKGWVNLVRN